MIAKSIKKFEKMASVKKKNLKQTFNIYLKNSNFAHRHSISGKVITSADA